MSAPKMLDLFSSAGGAGVGYSHAGFEVYAVDIDPQPNNPFQFLQADAIETLQLILGGSGVTFRNGETLYLSDFAAIHASPPCQSFLSLGKVNKALGRAYEYPNLIGPTRELLIATGLPYVIENVSDARAELIAPVRICGTALGLPLRRHRLFESNLPITGLACAHHKFTEKRYWTSWRPNGEVRLSTVVQVYGNGGNQHEWPAAMGIDWMTAHEMAEAIPPAYTELIGSQLLREAAAA
jgi:DNA (cytosine-5)-methyltransferase 1